MSNSSQATIIAAPYRNAATQDHNRHVNSYNGLRIHTLPGLHEHVANLIREHVGSNGAAVDLGAGSGALSDRIKEIGIEPTAVDYVEENFRLHDTIKFIRADLNDDFSDFLGEQFDLVTAVEIIEHLENPRHFLRQLNKLCKPNSGIIILTTPNIDNPVSKALFSRFGTFSWFSNENYREDGHITPLSRWQLQKIYEEIGLRVIYEGSLGDPFQHLGNWPKMKLLARLIKSLSIYDSALLGEVYVAVLGTGKTTAAT